ncbi:restriction endonuclease [Streptomyces sp. NBC_00063]|uniref:restriction endonuclease n=1 Tax=Streptomyces sp. NBC_00063 TaxID=2975638 RepID=UPI002258A369|nr:restriction endonuclease [Streptomyces sp. NBC_00063]MCX5440898.1 restriction endonuclease [Streptomyces sp. NBC_00063]
MTTSQPTGRARKIHPAAYNALIEALACIYWYKKDLRKFIETRAVGRSGLVAGLDYDGYKRAFAEEFVDRLMADEEQYRDLTLSVMLEVAQMDTFPSLKRHADAATLVPAAEEAVASLRIWTERHQGLVEEQEAMAAELAERRAKMEATQGFAGKLAALKDQFHELRQMQNRQRAGLLFEPFLNQLFNLFDLDARLSYELASEQIDGALTFDTDDYIVEAKWRKGAVEVEDLDKFDAKVRRKGKNALGLFLSVNGFTAGALREYDKRTSFLAMDGGDLICVLEARITLDELLGRKKRHANQTGNCYFPAHQALAE